MSTEPPDRNDPPDPFDEPMFPCGGIEDMFEAHRPYGRSETGFHAGRSFRPAANMYESPSGIVITLEIPGIERDKIDISVVGRHLTVSGSRNFVREHADEEFVRIERGFGSFRRIFEVPADIDHDGISAKLEIGVLTISIPCHKARREIKVEPEDTR